jgi:long-chain acyl-CoA synthetase
MSFVPQILAAAQHRGDRPLLIEMHGDKPVETSGRAFLADVARVRAYLQRAGIARGDRVGLLGPNSARWAAVDLAIVAHGAVCVPLYARQDPRQLAGMLGDAQARLLIAADGGLAQALRELLPAECAVDEYDSLWASDDTLPGAIDHPTDDPVTIIYTSGTSGEPKGVVLTAENFDYMLDVTVQRITRMTRMSKAERSEDRVFHYLPFCFAGSRIMLWSQLRRGNPLWLSTDLNRLQEEMRGAKPHYFLNVPVLLERIRAGVEKKLSDKGGPLFGLYRRALAASSSIGAQLGVRLGVIDRASLWLAKRLLFPRIKVLIGENLEFLVCGSAPLSEATQRWFGVLGLPVYQVYGLTETTGIVTIDDTDNVTPGRVGYAVPGCELRVSDSGELLCRGPNVFGGYFKRPEASADVLRDGWFHTGDHAELDATGCVKIIGRLKDVIVPESGHNVAPGPIEDRLLRAAAGIEQVVVVGHGRPYLTALVAGDIANDELERARERVNAELPHYQRLRRAYRVPEIFTPDNGLLTANQKLRRSAIEAHYREAIEEMYR